MIKLMMVSFCPIGVRYYSGEQVPGVGVGYEKKTVLHSFREVVAEFVFKEMKLTCKCWKWGSALRLKSQPNRSQFWACSGRIPVQQVFN